MTHAIAEAGKSLICKEDGQAGRLITQGRVDIAVTNLKAVWRQTSGDRSLFLLRPPTDWMRPIHIKEKNLLYLKFTNLNINLTLKNTFMLTSRLAFNRIFEYHGLAMLTCKINYHR